VSATQRWGRRLYHPCNVSVGHRSLLKVLANHIRVVLPCVAHQVPVGMMQIWKNYSCILAGLLSRLDYVGNTTSSVKSHENPPLRLFVRYLKYNGIFSLIYTKKFQVCQVFSYPFRGFHSVRGNILPISIALGCRL